MPSIVLVYSVAMVSCSSNYMQLFASGGCRHLPHERFVSSGPGIAMAICYPLTSHVPNTAATRTYLCSITSVGFSPQSYLLDVEVILAHPRPLFVKIKNILFTLLLSLYHPYKNTKSKQVAELLDYSRFY